MAAPPPASSSKKAETSGGGSIGRYKRLDQVGKGSFATVYRGIHPVSTLADVYLHPLHLTDTLQENGSLIAIKTVQHHHLKGKLKANLFSEISIMREITHPHIVGLVDILESTNHIHLIMEFCQLGDLATFVKKRDKLASHPVTADMLRRYPNPPGAGFHEVIVRHFAKQLASALQFLRTKNLVHRDLKPQNLLLNPPYTWIKQELPENQPFAVSKNSLVPATGLDSLPFLKIADFGFARHLPTTTMAETLCGSPLYMAPEILRYEKYDAKADLWSVGTVLFELVTGRPPFRAANHVDLLRKIERAMDNIKFPDDSKISHEMRDVIQRLLKKTPTERLSWEGFFANVVITQEIPGLVSSDAPQKATRSSELKRSGETEKSARLVQEERRPSVSRAASQRTSEERAPSDQPRFSTPPESLANVPRRSSFKKPRPNLTDRATAPNVVPGVRSDRLSQDSSGRRKSIQPPSPSSSALKELSDRERGLQQRQVDRATKDVRDRAAQDVAFERDYVMVEKRAVEVNAFADELAASPHVQNGSPNSPSMQPAAMARRATTQAVPSASKTGQPSSTSRGMQLALRPESAQQRRASYDRRFPPCKTSAQSALAAALNMVNLRFVNNPFTPALGKGAPSSQGYGPFPTFPAQPTAPLLLSDAPRDKAPTDEDHRVLSIMEDSATRSDVVYSFAEVKYKQLVPIAPSSDNALRGREEPIEEDDGLTPDAIIGISEEALVLYLKALAILTNTINLAGTWWGYKTHLRETGTAEQLTQPPRGPREGASGSSGSKSSGFAAVGARINSVVQWSRNRFNECLEKSEFVSRKLIYAQRKLHSYDEAMSVTPSKHLGDLKNDKSEINIKSGVTAEKLMYDRALDMSKAAAVDELVGEDLPGCEVGYLTAIRLLEAVIEKDEEDLRHSKKERPKKAKREDGSNENNEGEDTDRDADKLVSEEDGESVVARKLSLFPSTCSHSALSPRLLTYHSD